MEGQMDCGQPRPPIWTRMAGHEPVAVVRHVWSSAFMRPSPAKAGTPNPGFMGSEHFQNPDVNRDHEPSESPSTALRAPSPPTGGEGRDEGVTVHGKSPDLLAAHR